MSIIPDSKTSSFATNVYRLTSLVPKGKVTTYGRLAALLGHPKGARAVGQALHCNPFAPVVPCHRVIKSDGSVGGFASGPSAKIKLLKSEGVIIEKGKIDLNLYGYK